MEKVGRGKYSDVFKAMKVSTNSYACLKILKPGTFYFNKSKS